MKLRLSDDLVRTLLAPAKGNVVYWDAANKRGNDWTPGFGLRVTAAGARSFILNFRTKEGTARRYTIGGYPALTLLAARSEAKKLKAAIHGGADPVSEDRERRNAETVADLGKRFLEEHVARKRPATKRDYTAIVEEIVDEIGGMKVAAVAFENVDRLHRKISARAPFRANRVVAVASKMFNLSIRWKMRTDNPVKGVERNAEGKRKRYLSADELARLTKALTYVDQQAANAFRLLLLTGARSGEVFAATWDQFDVTAGKWTKPGATTKQKTTHEVPLSPAARQLLQRIRRQQDENETFVFPSDGKTGHVTTLKKSWREVCKAAGITKLRIHDLRHSYASMAISAGWSLPVVGALLGHTQPSTTQRYAHIVDDVLHRATNTVGAVVSGRKKAPVVPFGRRR
jgi:integrase